MVVVGAGDDQGQVLVLVVVVVPAGQLLVAVGGVIDGVEVERQAARRDREGVQELADEELAEPFERGDGDRILEPREGGLAGQVRPVGTATEEEFEDRVGGQGSGVVLVLIVGEDAVDPLADQICEGVVTAGTVAWVVQGSGEGLGQAQVAHPSWRNSNSPASWECNSSRA